LAIAATGLINTIIFQGSFHGRTHLAMAMTILRNLWLFDSLNCTTYGNKRTDWNGIFPFSICPM